MTTVLSPTLTYAPAEPVSLFQTIMLSPAPIYQVPIARQSAEYIRVPTYVQAYSPPLPAPALKERPKEIREENQEKVHERAQPVRERAQPPPPPPAAKQQEITKEVRLS